MFDLRIFNDSLDKNYVNRVSFPHCPDVVGDIPTVRMIVLDDGTALFEMSDLVLGITEYVNGSFGVFSSKIRDIVRTYVGWGMVIQFRRGGIYADIQAAQSIAKHYFEHQDNAPKYCAVARPALLYSLSSCPVHQYTGLQVPQDSRFPLSQLTAIVPSTLDVSKLSVSGVPTVNETLQGEEVTVEKHSEQPTQNDSEQEPDNSKATLLEPSTGVGSGALNSSIGALVAQLISGKKLTITVSLD